MKVMRVALALLSAGWLAVVAAQASPITYNVTATSDKGSISGTFSVDGSTITNFSFNLSGLKNDLSDFGSVDLKSVDNSGGFTLNSNDAQSFYYVAAPSSIFPQGFTELYFYSFMSELGGREYPYGTSNQNVATTLGLYFSALPGTMNFGNPPTYPETSSVQQYALLPGGNYGYTSFWDFFTSGNTTATPEPASGTLMASGILLLAGLCSYKRLVL